MSGQRRPIAYICPEPEEHPAITLGPHELGWSSRSPHFIREGPPGEVEPSPGALATMSGCGGGRPGC